MGCRGPGEVRAVRLLPGVRLVFFLRRWDIDRVVEPPVPRRGDGRGLRNAAVDHPAPLHVERGVDLAAARAVIAVAEFVLSDEFPVQPRPPLRAEGLAVPPGK